MDLPMSGKTTAKSQTWPQSEALVINEKGQPIKPGETGELLVRTAAMKSGYWQQPEAQTTAFFHTRVANQPAVFYRTGELAKRGTDGQYQLIERKPSCA
ncbi:MAG: hypothetical protein AAFN40_14925 [Cyanobacteria bacterium J06560_6]